mgnify:CR=1 FL=1
MKKTLIVSLLLISGISSSWAKPGGWIKDLLKNNSSTRELHYHYESPTYYERPVYYYPQAPVVIYERPRYYVPPAYIPVQPYQNTYYYPHCR